mmetsp:Transcript_13906/g.27756  ORF Transcript_13906/g.27756 Transcript_13906/m.27756 type:complete len:246 (-) Transcript_13906:656-1393(-)
MIDVDFSSFAFLHHLLCFFRTEESSFRHSDTLNAHEIPRWTKVNERSTMRAVGDNPPPSSSDAEGADWGGSIPCRRRKRVAMKTASPQRLFTCAIAPKTAIGLIGGSRSFHFFTHVLGRTKRTREPERPRKPKRPNCAQRSQLLAASFTPPIRTSEKLCVARPTQEALNKFHVPSTASRHSVSPSHRSPPPSLPFSSPSVSFRWEENPGPTLLHSSQSGSFTSGPKRNSSISTAPATPSSFALTA